MRTNTKAVVTGDSLRVHWGTGAFWELAMIIHVQHLQICFKSAGTVEKRQVLVAIYKVYGAESAFPILISDLFEPVGPPLRGDWEGVGGALLEKSVKTKDILYAKH